MGRPPMAAEDRRTIPLKVLTTQAEREELQEAAQAASLDVSTWVRAVALERARKGAKAG